MLKNFIGFVTTFIFGLAWGSIASAQEANFGVGGLWWNAQEPGWGVAVDQQGGNPAVDPQGGNPFGARALFRGLPYPLVVFAALATYDVDGSPVWFVMPRAEYDFLNETGPNAYWGTMYQLTGPAFGAVPFDSSMVTVTRIGEGGFQFPTSGANEVGVFSSFIGGIPHVKNITRQVFADPVPICAVGATPGPIPNYQGMWWNAPAGSESGWGIHLTHQGDIIFAVWFTFDSTGKATWLVMTATKTAPNTYAGAIYRTTGPAYNAATFDPSSVTETQVGSATLTFTDRDNGAFAYAVNSVSQTKNITRQIFAAAHTVCN